MTLQDQADRVYSVAFSPDGQILASGNNDRTIRLWDVNTGSCLKILKGHDDRVRSIAFSSVGSLLVSGSEDGTMKLWDVQTSKCLKTLRSDRPYERMNITGVKGLTESQKASLYALGAVENE
jgi:WD40 repeat protein